MSGIAGPGPGLMPAPTPDACRVIRGPASRERPEEQATRIENHEPNQRGVKLTYLRDHRGSTLLRILTARSPERSVVNQIVNPGWLGWTGRHASSLSRMVQSVASPRSLDVRSPASRSHTASADDQTSRLPDQPRGSCAQPLLTLPRASCGWACSPARWVVRARTRWPPLSRRNHRVDPLLTPLGPDGEAL